MCLKNIFFYGCCATTMFLVRLLRIGPVQSVVNSPTQLSGRGFPHIFYMKIFVSQHYVFWYSKLEVGPCNLKFRKTSLPRLPAGGPEE